MFLGPALKTRQQKDQKDSMIGKATPYCRLIQNRFLISHFARKRRERGRERDEEEREGGREREKGEGERGREREKLTTYLTLRS